MFEAEEMVNSPPYCGLPSLSHQFPVVIVVVAVGFVVFAVAVMVARVVVLANVDVVMDVVTDGMVDVDVLQDPKTSDVTKSQASSTQITPFFI